MENKIRDILRGPEAQLGGQGSLLGGEGRLRPGCWAFALDPCGTGFHPQFPITQHVSSAQPLLNFLCGNVVVVFILFWFCLFFLTARRICVFLGFCLSLSCTAIFCLLCCCELGNEAPSFLRNIHYLHAFSNFQQSQLFLE